MDTLIKPLDSEFRNSCKKFSIRKQYFLFWHLNIYNWNSKFIY